jgi:SHS2 domain-containing protein
MLLFDFLQELIYFKDARRLLLRACAMQIDDKNEEYLLKAKVAGEQLDDTRHQQRADVKAVTLHGFSVQKHDSGWRARVLLDI